MLKPSHRILAKFVPLAFVLSGISTGCAEKEHRVVEEERGRHVRIRAPFTKVDVWVPDDDEEDPRVEVEVDD